MGRVGYPPALAEAVTDELRLDGSGRLLDIGCGPGSFTLLLAPWFAQATGIDAQSFHWMDQLRVARTALGMLEDGGVCVHVHAMTHQGVETDAALPHPRPPRAAISELVESYLGPVPQKGKGLLSPDMANREDKIYRAAGFDDRHRIETPGDIVERTSDQIVAGIFSLSSSTPHLFGERRGAFEADLRRLLHDANPTGIFSEQMRDIAVDIWRAN
jgi:SAM-dependent methyltransferase